MERLTGRLAVVTGAGAGIGRAIARRLASEGASLIVLDRQPEGLAETEALLGEAAHGAGQVVRCLEGDVTDPALPDRLRALLAELGRPLDVLVNNAGIGGGGMAHETSDADLQRYLDVNLVGLFRLSRFAVEAMRGRGGVILNLASIYSFIGATGSAAYSATKAAVAGLTRQMATDYGPEGIRVVALAPGLIETPLTAERIRSERWRRHIYIDQSPLRRVGRPEDIAAAAAFLVSDDASFVTGETLRVDGGWTLGRYPRPTAEWAE
ncbi:3-oxoacyl-[acyl-carrier protein] reductase [Tistlia consotensis]|uniref:3-oxoacyl-[acyl-carrier protein] reductase n=1 Tax=Tistlia consotensis USBA 355 TaxID=560819 RepID=A0A1Y6C3M2_9PROT|nr:glucose 1-dehydrogenase [Tistlia consotensis]SMF35537.1 3-oxoacyl-[acyl-carrier protein] reductase [Tistlia consotensis USBA 355]SNR70896.1 3-oxoacyl-[acyl-carrier protein] reductase [Tistlia consotensis]